MALRRVCQGKKNWAMISTGIVLLKDLISTGIILALKQQSKLYKFINFCLWPFYSWKIWILSNYSNFKTANVNVNKYWETTSKICLIYKKQSLTLISQFILNKLLQNKQQCLFSLNKGHLIILYSYTLKLLNRTKCYLCSIY